MVNAPRALPRGDTDIAVAPRIRRAFDPHSVRGILPLEQTAVDKPCAEHRIAEAAHRRVGNQCVDVLDKLRSADRLIGKRKCRTLLLRERERLRADRSCFRLWWGNASRGVGEHVGDEGEAFGAARVRKRKGFTALRIAPLGERLDIGAGAQQLLIFHHDKSPQTMVRHRCQREIKI